MTFDETAAFVRNAVGKKIVAVNLYDARTFGVDAYDYAMIRSIVMDDGTELFFSGDHHIGDETAYVDPTPNGYMGDHPFVRVEAE